MTTLRALQMSSVLLAGNLLSPLCLGSEPQAKAGSPPQAKSRSAATASKERSQIKVADATPEDALRTFMLAVMAQDEAALRVVTLPSADLAWLLRGQPAPPEVINGATAQFAKQPIKRLKDGEKVTLPKGKQYVVTASEVGEDRAVLLPQGAPVPTRLRKVDNHWKVAADPFIAASKAADASMKKAQADKAASKR
jgi:hypothetical protein